MESKVPYRVYAVLNEDGDVKSITFHDKNGMRYKQIDLLVPHYPDEKIGEGHVHHGYFHHENDKNGNPSRELTRTERKIKNMVVGYAKRRKNNGKGKV